MKNRKGFTLVELLAVIVILAVILVIAIPQIMNTIKAARLGTIENSAKLIAKNAEEDYLSQQALNQNYEATSIPCADVAKLSEDYASCSITYDGKGVATVTLKGASGSKFNNISCTGTKDNMSCSESGEVQEQIDVKIPYRITYNAPKSITSDYFYYTITPTDGAVPPMGNTNGIYIFELLGKPAVVRQDEISLSFIYSKPGEYVYELESYEPHPRENITRDARKYIITILIISDNDKLECSGIFIKDISGMLYSRINLIETYEDNDVPPTQDPDGS